MKLQKTSQSWHTEHMEAKKHYVMKSAYAFYCKVLISVTCLTLILGHFLFSEGHDRDVWESYEVVSGPSSCSSWCLESTSLSSLTRRLTSGFKDSSSSSIFNSFWDNTMTAKPYHVTQHQARNSSQKRYSYHTYLLI